MIGRFTTIDPLGRWGDPGNTGNGYTYVANNPWSMLDPFGLCPPSANKPHKRTWKEWWGEVRDEAYWNFIAAWNAFKGAVPFGGRDIQLGRAVALKAIVNAAFDTLASTFTFGFVDDVEIWKVTEEDLANGYRSSYTFARIGTEAGFAAITSGLSALTRGGRVVFFATKVALGFDIGNSIASVGRGLYDMVASGQATVGNVVQVVLGAVGAAAGGKAAKGLTGQEHHAISKKVARALEDNPNLAGKYTPRDPRFVTQAKDAASHRGYQTWHRELDDEVVEWLRKRPDATQAQFEKWLRDRYNKPDLKGRFPNGLP